ncbi:Vmc-like lipoprotein signal peptide domain-containing protein [Mycoplasma bradburyae]|uniref:Vmc-like lipoprotein signal peptide domain-containing protein n=1 Tax=Mycoplasma bradburyae TaxID=2963128 RepID=UPI002340CE10|nr:hypothetical protein [Mycoplasma bradburyae]MDC4183943.1 hypothetical protein [Mycoplasma bradburyae]
MKQKTKKLLQLSFSLGFLATTALVATSCNQPKTVKPKPTDPSKPTGSKNPSTGNPEQPSNPMEPVKPTEPAKPVDTTEAKNKLKEVISTKTEKLGMYADYSVIKGELQNAYAAAELVSEKQNATEQELTDAKNKLDAAITKAETDKTAFDNNHADIVTAYTELKTIVLNKNQALSSLNEDKYNGLKSIIETYYTTGQDIINNGLQAEELNKQKIDDTKNSINGVITDINTKKTNVDEYFNAKKFPILESNFKGMFAKTQTNANDNNKYIVGFSQPITNNTWKYAKRKIAGVNDANEVAKITDVAWIYDLSPQGMNASKYQFDFTYFGGKTATLWFPYKSYKTDQNSSNLALQYKINDKAEQNIEAITDATVADIKVAQIPLSELVFGSNTISFSVPNGKENPMIGNMYITLSDSEENKNKVYNSIFGSEKDSTNQNAITVNFAKGYGLAKFPVKNPEYQTNITKLSGTLNDQGEAKTFYLIGYLGSKVSLDTSDDEKYYVFYVNVEKEGLYEISGLFSSGENRRLSFWRDSYNNNMYKAKFKDLNSYNDWNKLKSFGKNDKLDEQTPTSLQLKKGLNKIIVSGDITSSKHDAPNLGNVTFTLTTNK